MRESVISTGLSKRTFLFFVLLMSLNLCAMNTRAEAEETTFARVYCDYDKIVVGDSCLVSYVIYSSSPFRVIENMSKLKVKNGKVHASPLPRQRLQRVREQNRVYYALLVEDYVVKTKDVGALILQPRTYEVELTIEEYADPFDSFFGPPARVRKVNLKGKCNRLELNVIEKPKRTTKQMLNSGLEII